MMLDVGCGDSSKGSVNCDIVKHVAQNFILCDAQYLPFKNNSFSTVYSSHVVEHVEDPKLMVEELLRVAIKRVIIKTPHLLSYSSRGLPILSKLTGFTYHNHAWSERFWKNLLINYKLSVKTKPRLTPQFWWVPFKTINMIIEVCL